MTRAEEQYIILVEQLGEHLHSVKVREIVPLADYEKTYRELRGLKGFWDGASWDTIQRAIESSWLKEVRDDSQFKEYYSIRLEIDKLEVLV